MVKNVPKYGRWVALLMIGYAISVVVANIWGIQWDQGYLREFTDYFGSGYTAQYQYFTVAIDLITLATIASAVFGLIGVLALVWKISVIPITRFTFFFFTTSMAVIYLAYESLTTGFYGSILGSGSLKLSSALIPLLQVSQAKHQQRILVDLVLLLILATVTYAFWRFDFTQKEK